MCDFTATTASLLARQTIQFTPRDVQNMLDQVIAARGLRVVSFLNTFALALARRDAAFQAALLGADLLLRDGVGIEIVMKAAGLAPGLNLNGTDLIPQIVARLDRGQRIALLGTRDPALAGAAAHLGRLGFGDVITCHGFHPAATYLDLIRRDRPDVVILGMGMPKQEMVAQQIAHDPDLAGRDLLVINGGGIMDFMGGAARRAPVWMRRAKIEWLWRLAWNPPKILHRLLVTLPVLYCALIKGTDLAHAVATTRQTHPEAAE